MQLDNVFGKVRLDLESKIKTLKDDAKLYQTGIDETILKGDYKAAFGYYTESTICLSQAIALYDVFETLFAESDSQKAEVKALYRILERNTVRLADLRFSIDQVKAVPA